MSRASPTHLPMMLCQFLIIHWQAGHALLCLNRPFSEPRMYSLLCKDPSYLLHCPLFKVLLSSQANAFLIIPCKSAAHILTPECVKGFQSLASIRFPCHNILCCCVSSSSQFHCTKGNVIKLVQ